ncbi:hypothetical protein N0V88_000302 [Collariella sp. IMI 366227]|nr:hypothetical protein N0V88_000302 [Collariella sp. IMI 366227]
MARKPESYADIVSEIKQQGGEALGVSADASDPASVASAMESIKREMPGRELAAAVCKFAVRALSQSLAREFGPQGVHVAHHRSAFTHELDLRPFVEKF